MSVDSGKTINDYLTFSNISITICVNCQMENTESKEEIYNRAKSQHTLSDRRLQMLLKKPYLTAEEELETRVLKRKNCIIKTQWIMRQSSMR